MSTHSTCCRFWNTKLKTTAFNLFIAVTDRQNKRPRKESYPPWIMQNARSFGLRGKGKVTNCSCSCAFQHLLKLESLNPSKIVVIAHQKQDETYRPATTSRTSTNINRMQRIVQLYKFSCRRIFRELRKLNNWPIPTKVWHGTSYSRLSFLARLAHLLYRWRR